MCRYVEDDDSVNYDLFHVENMFFERFAIV